MPETFLQLSSKDRREALQVISTASGRPLHLLEKDVWVVWALSKLFASQFAEHLVFKGGTSLSKAYQVIRRFSEDVDLTYDIRAIAADLIGDQAEALPPNRSQEKKWTSEIRGRLGALVANEILPFIAGQLAAENLPAKASAAEDRILIEYDPLAVGSGYVRPAVLLEFGARSTGEPWESLPVVCDAAEHLPELAFPTAQPRVMRIGRTFWEKATAVHVYCLQGKFRGGERFARHWHDLARIDEAGHADGALADRDVAQAVARHKAVFFAEKDEKGNAIDYAAAVSGELQLVPENGAYDALAKDYQAMVDDGLLLGDAESFDVLIEKCRVIQEKAASKKV